MGYRKGIDISTYQTNVDYQKLKEQNIDFAIIRCGYGKDKNQKDKMFEKHYEGLKSVGIAVGAYLYSYCTSLENSYKEANNCLEMIKGKSFELPIFYDLEEKRTADLGKNVVTQMAINFCNTIQQAGYKAGVYANLNWFRNYLNVNDLLPYYIWLAQWNDTHSADFRVDFWQYTSKGQILGINGNVDLNYDLRYHEEDKKDDLITGYRKGIDISTYQKNVDYQKLKEQNIDFAIIRCGYGKDKNQKDKMFETHYQGLKNAGIAVGTYLYSYCTSLENSYKEANNCLEMIKGKSFELPIFYDLEEKRTADLGKNVVTQMAINFCNTIQQAGYKAGVYANLNWFRNYLNVNDLLPYYIWLAQWSDKHSANFRVDFWQYTSKGQIPGINGNVDLNYDLRYNENHIVK